HRAGKESAGIGARIIGRKVMADKREASHRAQLYLITPSHLSVSHKRWFENTDMGEPRPRRLELRSERDQQQHGQHVTFSMTMSSSSSEVASLRCASSKTAITGRWRASPSSCRTKAVSVNWRRCRASAVNNG